MTAASNKTNESFDFDETKKKAIQSAQNDVDRRVIVKKTVRAICDLIDAVKPNFEISDYYSCYWSMKTGEYSFIFRRGLEFLKFLVKDRTSDIIFVVYTENMHLIRDAFKKKDADGKFQYDIKAACDSLKKAIEAEDATISYEASTGDVLHGSLLDLEDDLTKRTPEADVTLNIMRDLVFTFSNLAKEFKMNESLDFDDDIATANAEAASDIEYYKHVKEIEKWLMYMDLTDIAETTPEGINVHGDCYINSNHLGKIPWKFNIVEGNFNCSENDLTSLKNCPNVVKGSFNCQKNYIGYEYDEKSMKYKKTKRIYDINHLFKDAPKIIEGTFKGFSQKYGDNPYLTDYYYKNWSNNVIEEDVKPFAFKVKLVGQDVFGDLICVNEAKTLCSIVSEDGKVISDIPTDKVEVLEDPEKILSL